GAALDRAARLHKSASEERCSEALDVLVQVGALRKDLQAGFLFRGARARAAASILDKLAQYLATRWDGLVAMTLSRVFQELQVNLHKYRRSVDCCRKRIEQFVKTFGATAGSEPRADLGLGRYLLPFGCRTLEEAVRRILDSLPP